MLEYRNELKFVCSDCDLEILKSRLLPVMKLDSHMKSDHGYRIRSLYFDDFRNTAVHENMSGVDDRKKYRIRVYDDPKERISLEIKYKLRGKTHKDSCILSEELCRQIIMERRFTFHEDLPRPLKQLYLDMNMNLLKPNIITEYERIAFVYDLGNVRITFDRNISYSTNMEEFLEDKIELIPMMPKGYHVLEVKYDEFIPDHIAQLLELGNLQRTSFSKYYLSRLGGY